MSKTIFNAVLFFVFIVGLAAVCWIGIGYVGSNPIGAAVALLIGACYLVGAWELYSYRNATASLTKAVGNASLAQSNLRQWLGELHPSLRNAVRLRVEGERIALPAPALTPYLVGLLVLLGMLGTLLGMMATLRGTGFALESATDLQTIRGSLAAPVKGLAFAFGTSIAGVATSAMLGLLSALCRRERLQSVQLLDVEIATTLHTYSPAHQRSEAFKLLQQHTALLPTLVERLQTMTATLERQSASANEQLLARQEDLHARTEANYTRLTASLEDVLKTGVAESAQAVATTLQPIVETTLRGVTEQTATLHDTVTKAVQSQLDGLTTGFATVAAHTADTWKTALASQQHTNQVLAQDLRGTLEGFANTYEQRSASMVEAVAARLEANADAIANAWNAALARQTADHSQLAEHNQKALDAAAATFQSHAGTLIGTLQQSHEQLQAALESRDQQRLAQWSETFAKMTEGLKQHWEQTGEHVAARQQDICNTLATTATEISAHTQQHANATVAEISRLVQSAADLQNALEARDQQRLDHWSQTLAAMAEGLKQHWEQTGEHVAARQQDICNTLATTATEISAHTQQHANATVAEISRLVQSAADLQNALESRDQQRLDHWSQTLAAMAEGLKQHWEQTGEHVAARQQDICNTLATTATEISAHTQQHANATVAEISRLVQSAADLQNALEARDQQRLDHWSQTLTAMTETLSQRWEQAGERVAARQQDICNTLASTADEISAQAQRHTSETIAEISRLVQAASEAPKAAAEVVAELRQKLSDSMVRDTAMLEERSRLLATLETLLDAVNHASTEQRTAVDALVTTSADLMERVSNRFTDHIQNETGKLETVAAQITGSAVEVASLGDAFAASVQEFGQSNEALMERLQHIATALDTVLARSDEQLAYYVAQAREVVDLSVLSQKQIIEELQQLSSRQASAGTEPA